MTQKPWRCVFFLSRKWKSTKPLNGCMHDGQKRGSTFPAALWEETKERTRTSSYLHAQTKCLTSFPLVITDGQRLLPLSCHEECATSCRWNCSLHDREVDVNELPGDKQQTFMLGYTSRQDRPHVEAVNVSGWVLLQLWLTLVNDYTHWTIKYLW